GARAESDRGRARRGRWRGSRRWVRRARGLEARTSRWSERDRRRGSSKRGAQVLSSLFIETPMKRLGQEDPRSVEQALHEPAPAGSVGVLAEHRYVLGGELLLVAGELVGVGA